MIAWIGVITALFAATIAVAQNDIKKVLAYSTVSQLGYMFLAVGSGAYVAAIFHMVTHAFFKALLFLGSGSVIHGMHDEQDMRRMGLLRKFLPITAATFIVGWLAIAGVPPFAGFWSKDEILLFALAKSPALYVVGLVTALLTAYYMTRQVIMVFFGEARWEDRAAEHGAHGDFKPHESPWIMLFPLVVLAGAVDRRRDHPAAVRAWIPDSTARLEHWLEPVVEFGEARHRAARGPTDNKTILMLDRHGRPPSLGHRRRLARLRRSAGSRPSSRRSSPTPGTTTRRSPTSWAGPAGSRSRRRRGSTPTSSTARSTAPARPCAPSAGELRKGQTGYVRGYAGDHRRRRRRAPRLVRARAGDPDGRASLDRALGDGFPGSLDRRLGSLTCPVRPAILLVVVAAVASPPSAGPSSSS